MRIETIVRLPDQCLIEAPFTASRFVAGHEQDGAPPRVKGKGHAPHAVRGIESKLLHIGVARSVQRIGPGTAQRRAECFEKLRMGKQLVLHLGGERVKLRIEGRIKLDFPTHPPIMH